MSPGFVATLTLAYIGAFTAFVPLLTLLLPLQAQALAPSDKVGLLSPLTLARAVVASAANLAAGWLSDRTRHRFGRRRPWILVGLAGVVTAYAVTSGATTPWALPTGVMLFQLTFNLMFSPLTAVFADRVPDHQKGQVAAFLGLGVPIGAVAGVVITGPLASTPPERLLLLAVLVSACLLPFVLTCRETQPCSPAVARSASRAKLLTKDFGYAWISRFCLQVAASVVNAYMLFSLADHARYAEQFRASTVESGLARLIAVSAGLTVLSGFLGGLASDRIARRKPFILVAAGLMAAGLCVFAGWPQWPGPLVGYCLYGIGMGLYTTVDVALVAQVLPSRRNTARDLGIMNLTNTRPTIVAPRLALAALGAERDRWPLLMVVSAASALAGGFIGLRIPRAA